MNNTAIILKDLKDKMDLINLFIECYLREPFTAGISKKYSNELRDILTKLLKSNKVLIENINNVKNKKTRTRTISQESNKTLYDDKSVRFENLSKGY